ncbi:uncharacterized protein F4812DRAFT_421043 [Daldinia caldariorum]|uniref:uncharacterized protein n=1 Tax=Daldinia caldariorum TaxID=326644 RepID=UPI002007A20D|nr:uncharacterized protein F4812DRAFT_421043 [Daldinia caldariorum]KAI1469956.1 hypothetical protein F4812DRAFT_421043 [Daldinia caldariorum]
MSDESEDDYDQLRRLDMPLISTQTTTLNTYGIRPGGQPASLTAVNVPGTTDFVLGIDTCGFTTASTVTCNFGYECTNVGGYRGCCLPGAGDCASTIYTDCVDHDDISNTAECESQTLCCPSSRPSCYTYWFDDDSGPQDTFKLIDCQTLRGFGILYPFPPEMTMTSDTSTVSTQYSEPTNSEQATAGSESDSSTPAGTIAGAVVGSVAFVIILVIVAILIICRRRSNKAAATGPPVPMKSAGSSIDTVPTLEKQQRQTAAAAAKPSRRSFLRPLSMIREHPLAIPNPNPTPTPASGIRRHKSAAAHHSPRSNWPLGHPGNPLGSHPVDANLRKRLSDSRLGTVGSLPGERDIVAERGHDTLRVPVLQFPPPPPPPPPPPGTRSVSPLKPTRGDDDDGDYKGTGGGAVTPTSAAAAAALKSPRLQHAPVSPIMSRVLDGIGPRRAASQGSTSASVSAPFSGARRTSTGGGANAEPVSPIGSDGRGEGEEGLEYLPRVSYMSTSTFATTRDKASRRDELVSPIGVDEAVSDTEELESLVTVSPLESRRGSMDS